MKSPALDSPLLKHISEGSYAAESPVTSLPIEPAQNNSVNLRARVAATVRKARAQREVELQKASDRANAERREVQQKAKNALLSLLADDVIDVIVGKHAALGELHIGTIKITRNGVELIRDGGAGAFHTEGERLDIRFDGAILQAGQQLKSLEFQNRVLELQAQGIKIDSVYDTSSQGILITFDYGGALN
ncbi:hypothetical protein Rleg4DRAFT_6961 [Rhizobium leguminosarum bv. trifolii WSM2297]|uniref:Uncharacterized protein n=1 Tax=Rhizobium leguminosarum bv. trifolii WSM2297 TaxID=754762 RepID=J0WI04_RHILT|nr:hypothetical protein [Rhizobium leguminosarum]EJC83308.1 hypothetical protein Rleg4DRAFT_5060 [Rhizobium leguminosarum bv. trifolii WSM2297]EJC85098.1 hypothetical protein Rleg4DRAFT_6961 [Rhizobium leguminosarum bv. trifolii WSM2297]